MAKRSRKITKKTKSKRRASKSKRSHKRHFGNPSQELRTKLDAYKKMGYISGEPKYIPKKGEKPDWIFRRHGRTGKMQLLSRKQMEAEARDLL